MFMYEIEVPQIDHGTGTLTQDEDGILLVDRVGQEQETSHDAEIPEQGGHRALFLFLAREPLDDPPAEKKKLRKDPQTHPKIRHRTPALPVSCTGEIYPSSIGQRADPEKAGPDGSG